MPALKPAAAFEYPGHLRDGLGDLPDAPGVYTFHGQAGDIPLYIGKSIHLRSRVLAHLRNPAEANLLRQTTRISHIRCAGEIGALLLEAQMIKQQQPLLNRLLRRTRQLCSLRLTGERPEVVAARDIDFASAPDLYGLYASERAALQALRDLADANRLCYAALGLEKPVAGRACFRAMLRQCAGVCRGDESPADHRQRLFTSLEGLRVLCWPHPGAVGLVERWGKEARQIHVVRNWCYLGSASRLPQARKLGRVAAGFDADGYKILCRPLLGGKATIIPL